MGDKERDFLITAGLGIGEIALQIISMISQKGIVLIATGICAIILVLMIIKLYRKYKRLENNYEFIKFLFFGSKDNGFNFFPKLKIYMDYLGDNNQLEIETMQFEYIADLDNNCSDVTWTMKNVYNNTKNPINTYYLYSSNEAGMTNEGQMEIRGVNKALSIDASRVESRNGIQKTPYTFNEPIKPKERIQEIKIHMKMHNIVKTAQHRVVYLYPKNYGTKVKHMEIEYQIIGVKSAIVKLHEVGKIGKEYCDDEIKTGIVSDINGIKKCNFSLDENEININNLYYLLIKSTI